VRVFYLFYKAESIFQFFDGIVTNEVLAMKGSVKEEDSVEFRFNPIGVVHSCFKEKFGIPRQPGLVSEARATLELMPPFNRSEAMVELESFSHIWIIFVFHEAMREQWRPTVRPPRLGGNQRVGVFASRSPFRPNPIGMSVVKLEKIECDGGCCLLHLRGADLLDGTPVLDIKPYLPYADALPEAVGGYASDHPSPAIFITFSELAEAQCAELERNGTLGLRQLIKQVLLQDPRPAYLVNSKNVHEKHSEKQLFGMRLYDFDLHWTVKEDQIEVVELAPVADV
jgi:tRNA-Thr(GGU) m(6)t(6)A37 methyltransferase TsaA